MEGAMDIDVLRRHIRKESITNGISNMLFNGVIAWLLLRSKGTLSLWGEHSFGVDLIATAFLLLFIISLIVIPIHKKKVRNGGLPTWPWDEARISDRVLRNLPANTVLGGMAFGLFGILVVSPLTLLPFMVFGVTQMDPFAFAVFKGLWAGALAGLTVGPMIRFALGHVEIKV